MTDDPNDPCSTVKGKKVLLISGMRKWWPMRELQFYSNGIMTTLIVGLKFDSAQIAIGIHYPVNKMTEL